MAKFLNEDGTTAFEVTVRATGTVEWTNEGVAELVEREVKRAKGKSRPPRNFKQSDVTRALKAVKSAGVKGSVEIGRDGTIKITEAEEGAHNNGQAQRNEWDDVLDHPPKIHPRLS